MKIKIILFEVLLLSMLMSFTAQAQSYKIGYVRIEKIFAEWPETKRSNTELQEFEAQLSSQLQAKVQDFQTKLADFQENAENMDAVTRRDTETELQNLQTRIQQFEGNAQQSIADKNAKLLQPLQVKLKEMIDQVAKADGYTHIFTYGSSLVFSSDESGDISKAVAQKLGFTLSDSE